MLALIAGTGDLPPALVARLSDRPLVCALDGFDPKLDVDVRFRLEHLGTFLADLKTRGVTRICMVGAVRRPPIDPTMIDAATVPLIPKIQAAMARGDDGALRLVIDILVDAGFAVVAAHEVAADLLPPAGVLTRANPADWHEADAAEGEACVTAMGLADQGQACIVRVGRVLAKEDETGSDAMIARFFEAYDPPIPLNPLEYVIGLGTSAVETVQEWLSGLEDTPVTADDGILFKAPKPQQDRRADLPVIGPATAMKAAEAGLSGIVIEAGGVMVLDLEGVCQILDGQGMFLWVRPRGGA